MKSGSIAETTSFECVIHGLQNSNFSQQTIQSPVVVVGIVVGLSVNNGI